jgi:hypothetical protein
VADEEVDVEPVRPLDDVVVLAYVLPRAPSKDFEILCKLLGSMFVCVYHNALKLAFHMEYSFMSSKMLGLDLRDL